MWRLFVRRYVRVFTNILGTAVAQWLRFCATNRKVTGSIPADVTVFFIDYGPGVDSTSNRNEYQEYFLGVKSRRCVRLTTYHHPVPLSRNLGTLTSWNPLGLSRPVMGLLYLFIYQYFRGLQESISIYQNTLCHIPENVYHKYILWM